MYTYRDFSQFSDPRIRVFGSRIYMSSGIFLQVRLSKAAHGTILEVKPYQIIPSDLAFQGKAQEGHSENASFRALILKP